MAEILVVVGTRPNFVKVAPVIRALADEDVDVRVLHTGQHYDWRMSGSFIEQLGMPEPDHHLEVGSGSHAQQTAGVLVGVERVILENRPDAVLVPGDVNSTMAAALAAVKLGVPVVHLEAGLRSGDWTMPEEINRVVCDRVADLLLCHSPEAVDNLAAEGIAGDHVQVVGNTMIDSLLDLLPAARAAGTLERLGLPRHGYVLVTLHRPALVDDLDRLAEVLEVLDDLAGTLPVVFPMHPRTRARIEALDGPGSRLTLLEPLEYVEFLALQDGARLVVTDSGGVQEETSVLGVDCVTYRTTTERPITVRLGTNRVVGLDPAALRSACEEILASEPRERAPEIPLWDGRAAPRAAESIATFVLTEGWRTRAADRRPQIEN